MAGLGHASSIIHNPRITLNTAGCPHATIEKKTCSIKLSIIYPSKLIVNLCALSSIFFLILKLLLSLPIPTMLATSLLPDRRAHRALLDSLSLTAKHRREAGDRRKGGGRQVGRYCLGLDLGLGRESGHFWDGINLFLPTIHLGRGGEMDRNSSNINHLKYNSPKWSVHYPRRHETLVNRWVGMACVPCIFGMLAWLGRQQVHHVARLQDKESKNGNFSPRIGHLGRKKEGRRMDGAGKTEHRHCGRTPADGEPSFKRC